MSTIDCEIQVTGAAQTLIYVDASGAGPARSVCYYRIATAGFIAATVSSARGALGGI